MYEDISKLVAFQKSHELVIEIYKITTKFPTSESYGLVSQIRRAATSIPSNIVEGKARGSNKEFKRFLLIARGSLEEVKYQLLLSKDLNYISMGEYNELIGLAEVAGKLINGLITKASNSIS